MSLHQQPAVPSVEAFADALLRVARPPIEPPIVDEKMTSLSVATPGAWPDGAIVKVRLRRRGDGPNGLLVHGWEGRPSDFASIADALVEAGMTVWIPELPGHGGSGGQRFSIPLAARVLLAVGAKAGPFAMALGHSVGGACLCHALEQGLPARRVVLVATPTHYGAFVRKMANQAGIKGLAVEALIEHMQTLIGEHPDWIDMERQVAARSEPSLFIHSRDDRVVSHEAARKAAEHWPGAEWLSVEGLGHKRLLSDVEVVKRVVNFGLQREV